MFREFHCISVAVDYYDIVRSIFTRYADEEFPIRHKKGDERATLVAKFKERRWKAMMHDLMLLDEWHEDMFMTIHY